MSTTTWEIGGLTWDGKPSTNGTVARTQIINAVSAIVFDDTLYKASIVAYNEDDTPSSESSGKFNTFYDVSPVTSSQTSPKSRLIISKLNSYSMTQEDLDYFAENVTFTYRDGDIPVDPPVDPPVEPEKSVSSAQSGNWEDTTTWVGGVVPTSTTVVTIEPTHTVTINSNVANYDDGAVHVKGSLKLANNAVLTMGLEDPETYGHLYLYKNSIVENIGNGHIKFACGSIKTVDTTETERAKFSCVVKPASFGNNSRRNDIKLHYIDVYGNSEQTEGMSFVVNWRETTSTVVGTLATANNKLDIKNSTFSNMNGLRDTSGNKVTNYPAFKLGESGWTGTGNFEVSVVNSDFRNVDTFYINGTSSANSSEWNITGNTIESTLEDASTKIFLFSNGSSSGVPINIKNNVYKDMVISTSGNNGWGAMSSTGTIIQCENNLDFRTGVTGGSDPSSGNTNTSSYFKKGITFFSETSTNPHSVSCYNINSYISEAYPSNMIETNHFMSGCRNMSNSLAIGEGDFMNFVGSWGATTNNVYNIINNTFINNREDTIDTFASMLLAENITSYNDPIVNVKNNLVYKKYGTPLSSFVRTNMEATTPLVVTLTNNATSVQNMDWTNSSYSALGDQSTNIYAQPEFVDDDRGLRQATTRLLGYTGNVTDNALVEPYLLSNGYTVVDGVPTQSPSLATSYTSKILDVVDWIFAGYAPKNKTLATSGEGGTYIGAVIPQIEPVTGGYYWCGIGKPAVKINEVVVVK